MNFVLENNVLCQVHTQCLAAATTIRLKPLTGVPPWKMPPNVTALQPYGTLTLMDRLDKSAAKIEIVWYSSRTDNGDGTYTYTILRAQEGTTARQWEVGEYAAQIPTAAGLFDGLAYSAGTLKSTYKLGIDITPLYPLHAMNRAATTGFAVLGSLDVTNNAGGTNFTRFTVGQVATNILFIDCADQANAKGALGLQAYGGKVAIGGATAPETLTVWGHAAPGTDNANTCGTSGLRWSAVWAANGTIQTSDGRDKVAVRASPLGLSFIEALRPVAYRWAVGGYDMVVEESVELVEEQETADVEEARWRIDIEGGKAVRREVRERVAVPLVDLVGVVDEAGEPVRDGDGRQFFHEAPRMRKVERVVRREVPVARPGRRQHFGLLAQDVRAAAEAAGVDFGGLVQVDPSDPASELALRYDQFVAPLIAAVQELSARVRALEQRKP